MSSEQDRTEVDRRRLLVAGAAAVGGLALVDAVAADAPGKQVEDRGAGLKITRLRAMTAGPKAYVKIETNHKLIGWGEVTGLEPHVACALAESLFELLDGENPTRVEYLWQKVYRAHRDIRGGPFMVHTIAGLDMALWDLTGKLYGVPLYRLLGGPTREKIRVYPTDKAHKVPPHGIYDHSGNPSDISRMVNAIKATRERVGPDGIVMFDAHCAVPPATLIQFAAAIKGYDLLFIEEPAVPGNVEVFKRLKEQIPIPLAAGERDRTLWEFAPYLHERCLDIVQPDVAHTGGVTSMKKIAMLAEAYQVPLAPHCTTSPLGASASLHVAASIPLLLIHETAMNAIEWGEQFLRRTWKVEKDGYASLPEGPGLGVEVDEKAMARV